MENGSSSDSIRRPVTYHPSVWGDYFLAHSSDVEELSIPEELLQRQKEEVKKLLYTTTNDIRSKLELIDAIQRLDLADQFESEIQQALNFFYLSEGGHNLYSVSLRFRLLRQGGYHVSCDVFENFKNHEGKFEESLIDNVEGLLSLYEAAHFGGHGEEILDEALDFCTTKLEALALNASGTRLAARINQALKQPIHKTPTVLEIKKFMSLYQENESHNEVVLNFAKLHFNKLQKIYQKELREITRWWKALDFETKLPFARNRVVECYFWVLGIYFEPEYWFGRMLLSRVLKLASVIDDIYDVYGTFDELELFTDAIRRWDVSALDGLPAYMKLCYKALLDVYDEAAKELEKIDRSYALPYAIKEMQKMILAYFEEAKWLHKKQIPTSMEEYMKVAIPSAGYMMVATISVVGMRDLMTYEVLNWVSSEPLMVMASSIIARLMDDLVEHESDGKASALGCYMKEHGATKEEAYKELERVVWKAWKDVNQEYVLTTWIPLFVRRCVLNSARVIYFLYKEGDGYTNSNNKTKDLIKSVLIDPVL